MASLSPPAWLLRKLVEHALVLLLGDLGDALARESGVLIERRLGHEDALPPDGERRHGYVLAFDGLGVEAAPHRGVAEGGKLLFVGASHDGLPRGEAVEHLSVAHREAGGLGPRVHDGVDSPALPDALLDEVEVRAPGVRSRRVVDELVVDDRSTARFAHAGGEAVAYLQRVGRTALQHARR